MTGLNFTVLGCGNGAQAIAAFLALKGNTVSIVGAEPYDIAKIDQIKEVGGIELKGVMNGFGKISPEDATIKIKNGVEEKDVVLLVVPAFAQNYFLGRIVRYLSKKQILVIVPGSFGCLRLFKMIRNTVLLNQFKSQNIVIAETSSLPFACRLLGQAKVEILGFKDEGSIPLAAIPAHETLDIIHMLGDSFYHFIAGDNVLEVSLNNINFPMHPIISLFNMARIEYFKGEFNFYGEGTTTSVAKVMEKVDQERLNVGDALGLKLPSLSHLVSNMYRSSLKGTDLHEMLSTSVVHTKTRGPDSLKHRYIIEDVAYGLVPIASLGAQLGVECRTINAIIHLFSIATGIEFMNEGVTIEKLGLNGFSADEIINYVRTGLHKSKGNQIEI